jgi:hypothetical protein
MENTTSITEATQYAVVRDGLVYLKAYLNFPERKIGEIKESEESSLRYFVNRFEIAKKKVFDLVQAIEQAQNKGSYLMKLIHLREYLSKFDAIGNYVELFDILDKEEEKLKEIITQNKKRNLEIKTALLAEAEHLLEGGDWNDTSDKFKELRTKWVKTGSVDKELDEEIEGKFQNLIETFFSRRKQYYEDKNRMVIERVNKYEDLIRQAEELVKTEKTSEDTRKMKHLQEEWKNVGKVPSVKAKDLWRIFKRLNTIYFDQLKGKTGHTSSRPSPAAPWEALCKRAEEIAKSGTNDALKNIKMVQTQWQTLGPLKHKGSFDLVERFKVAVSRVYEEDFINKTALRRFGLFFKKPEVEQLKLKISLINELLIKANSELKVFEENLQNVTMNQADRDMNKVIYGKFNSQKRKIDIMKTILEEHRARLNEIKP